MTGWDDATGRLGPGAEWYARQGWKVFPCFGIVRSSGCGCGMDHAQPKDWGKHPQGKLVPNGQKAATADVEQVRDWWRRDPEANVAVMCRESGFLVVDVDPRSGGLDSWDKLEEMTEGALPRTVQAVTGEYNARGGAHRGRHLFYRVAPGERLKPAIQGLPGVDIKHNGYVLINPSRHSSGLIYEWEEGAAPWERAMEVAPEELLALLRKTGPAAAAGGVTYGSVNVGGEKVDVDALIEDGIHEGERSNTLYRIACALGNEYPLRTEHGKASLRRVMLEINRQACKPPMTWGDGGPDDLAPQVESAIGFILEHPMSEKYWEGITDYKKLLESTERLSILEPPSVAGAAPGVPAVMPAVPAAGNAALPPDKDALMREDGGEAGNRSLTDVGNGRRLIDREGHRLRYTAGLGWFVWNGNYWSGDAGGLQTQEIAKNVPRGIIEEAARPGISEELSDAMAKWAMRTKASAARRNLITEAMSDERTLVPISLWDSYPYLLGVKNGVIDLRTGNISSGDPNLYITRQAEVAYTPGYRNTLWDMFLSDVTGGDVELQRWLQMAAGYTLTGLRHYEIMFLVYGPPGSGKSTFLEVLSALLGDYSQQLSGDVLTDNGQGGRSSDEYYMAKMMGRRLIVISELREATRMREDAIKRLTGESRLSGRNPGGEPFEFDAQGKLWIGTNHRPHINDRAMWRRIRAIPFNFVPEVANPDLKPRLLDPNGALPAALSWAVDGAAMLLNSKTRQPLAADMCRVVWDATREYQASEDRIGIFLDEETKEMPGGSVPLVDLHHVYKGWSELRGERWWTLTAFMRGLEEKGMPVEGRGSRAILLDRAVTPRVVASPSAVPWTTLVDRTR